MLSSSKNSKARNFFWKKKDRGERTRKNRSQLFLFSLKWWEKDMSVIKGHRKRLKSMERWALWHVYLTWIGHQLKIFNSFSTLSIWYAATPSPSSSFHFYVIVCIFILTNSFNSSPPPFLVWGQARWGIKIFSFLLPFKLMPILNLRLFLK